MRILLIDDFVPFRRLVASRIADHEGFEIVGEAGDGHTAVRLAVDLAPDLLLLDTSIPELNGIEVARQIRSLLPTTKVLFVTAQHAPQLVEAGRAIAHGYVHKMRVVSDLLPAMKAVLRGETFVSFADGRAD